MSGDHFDIRMGNQNERQHFYGAYSAIDHTFAGQRFVDANKTIGTTLQISLSVAQLVRITCGFSCQKVAKLALLLIERVQESKEYLRLRRKCVSNGHMPDDLSKICRKGYRCADIAHKV